MGKKIGRNEPCPCGSGKKYKKCCGQYENMDFSLPEDMLTGTPLDDYLYLHQGVALYAESIARFEDEGKELRKVENEKRGLRQRLSSLRGFDHDEKQKYWTWFKEEKKKSKLFKRTILGNLYMKGSVQSRDCWTIMKPWRKMPPPINPDSIMTN